MKGLLASFCKAVSGAAPGVEGAAMLNEAKKRKWTFSRAQFHASETLISIPQHGGSEKANREVQLHLD